MDSFNTIQMKKILTVGILSVLLHGVSLGQAAKKPNILFIAVDDLKPIIGAYGNTFIKTPNLDRLASRGTTFLNNYCQQAVCGPTRASIITGMRPDYTKIWDLKTQIRAVSPDIVTMPQYLITQGYSTQGIGKVFDPRNVDANLDKQSWSVPYYKTDKKYYVPGMGEPAEGRYQDPATKLAVEKVINEALAAGKTKAQANDEAGIKIKPATESLDVPDNAYNDGANILQAKDILGKLSKSDQPFFFAVGIAKPHLPFVAPKKYWDLYKREDITIAPFQEKITNSVDVSYHTAGELRAYTDMPADIAATPQKDFGLTLSADKQKELIHGYYAAISYTDALVGKLLDALDSLDLSKNTIVVLWGDHGWHLGDHNLWCKHSNFEEATHAPLFISAPGIKSNKTKSFSEHVDVFPTLCDLAGVPIPVQLQGKSLKPVMENATASVKEYSMSQYPRSSAAEESDRLGYADANVMGYSIREKQFRYTIWMRNSFRSTMPFNPKSVIGDELYDYKADPLEKHNVVKDKKYTETAKRLKQEMLRYFESQVKK
jgi:arylsulfatase A-like enzyme